MDTQPKHRSPAASWRVHGSPSSARAARSARCSSPSSSRRGARLLVVGRDADRLAALGTGVPVVADLGDARAGDAVAAAAREHLGGLDGLVNAAGVVAFGALVDTPDEVVEELFLTNVIGPIFLVRRLLPLLEESQRIHPPDQRSRGRASDAADGGLLRQQGRAQRRRDGPAHGAAPQPRRRVRRPPAAHRDRARRPARSPATAPRPAVGPGPGRRRPPDRGGPRRGRQGPRARGVRQ